MRTLQLIVLASLLLLGMAFSKSELAIEVETSLQELATETGSIYLDFQVTEEVLADMPYILVDMPTALYGSTRIMRAVLNERTATVVLRYNAMLEIFRAVDGEIEQDMSTTWDAVSNATYVYGESRFLVNDYTDRGGASPGAPISNPNPRNTTVFTSDGNRSTYVRYDRNGDVAYRSVCTRTRVYGVYTSTCTRN